MDERALRILEFDTIRTRLAAHTAFSGGRALAEALKPTDNPIWIEEGQQETEEAVKLLESGEGPPFGGIRDVRPYLERARVGALLEPQQLLDIAETAQGVRRLAGYIRQNAAEGGVLVDVAADIAEHKQLEEAIRRCITPEAQVRDDASPALARIRNQMRTLQVRIRTRIESIMREADAKKYLQEALITVRSGRYVLPVRQEYRSGVPGIVHDQSASGATLFIEPMPIVELGNELRRLESEEEEEILRILKRLSDAVAEAATALSRSVHAAARLDLAFAKARLALEWDCVRPRMTEERWLEIRQGRHPLLPADTVVPIDIWLGCETRALVITGPNTGGKTVTLKTVGLFVLMSHAGLQVPADEGTHIPLCDGVYVDIGDEQSIEQSLSTFSSHMRHIIEILKKAGPRSIVLLDELGAGTDPTEGAALAMALLEHFIGLSCLTVATTHYSELKSFAYTEPGVVNASVEFDVATLRPTYRLLIGVAGSSNAFAISERLGLDPAIIERARQRLTMEERKVEDLIQKVQKDRRAAERDRKRAEELRQELEMLQKKLMEEREQLRQRKQAILEEARTEAAELLRRARHETEELIGRLRRKGAEESVEEARAVRALMVEMERSLEDRQELVEPAARGSVPKRLEPGMQVQIASLGQVGTLLTVPDSGGQVQVQVGSLKVTVGVDDLSVIDEPGKSREHRPARDGTKSFVQQKVMTLSPELDLRGLTADEAIQRLARYLDEVILSNVASVRIIHGKGTGALRSAVQRFLDEHPQIGSYRLGDPTEGGDGVTIIEF